MNSPKAKIASPMPPIRPARTRSARRPAIGATTPSASGHGVISRPVSNALRPSTDWNRNGSVTYASICAANETVDVAIDMLKMRILQQVDGEQRRRHRPTRAGRAVAPAAIPPAISATPRPALSRAKVSAPKTVQPIIAALEKAETQSNGVPWPPTCGSASDPTITAAMPIGRLIRNSHGHDATLRMIAASVGPAAADIDRTNAL